MRAGRLRPLLDECVLQHAKQQLEQQLAQTPDDHPSRNQVVEALLWIDRGVYGGCSVCGETLDIAQVLRSPADKVCPLCRRVTRQLAARHGVGRARPLAEFGFASTLRAMTTTTNDDSMFPNLRRIADEIRVHIHLAGLDAKDTWSKLEARLLAFEGRAEQLGGRAKDQLALVGTMLEHELCELVGRLPTKRDHDQATNLGTN